MTANAKKRPTIGVLAGVQVYYGTILGKFIGPLLHGVSSASENRGCNLLLGCGMDSSSYTAAHPAWPVPSPEADFIPVGPWNTDGLIVFNPLFSEARSRYIQELIASGFPVVFAATGEEGPTVAIDNADAVRQALLHLMSHGHRQVAFIAGYPDDRLGDSGVRLNAFQKYAQDFGLAEDPRLIAYGSHGINGGQQAMRQIMQSGAPFTAVLASNDESAIGAMNELKAAGLRIPGDVAMIGNDDTFEALTQAPPLTTFHSSPFRMGYRALELLLDYVEGRSQRLESVTIPMQFVVRQSCGCQPSVLPRIEISTANGPILHDAALVQSQIARTIAEIVLAGTQRLSPGEVYERCAHLVEAFLESLRSKDPALFQGSLVETLARVESLEDDMYVWNAGLSVLEGGLGLVRKLLAWPPSDHQPGMMVAEGRATVTQYMERQHRRLIIHQIWIADQVGQLNARLLTALDEAQVYEILANSLPQVGIQDVAVTFLEAEGGDPAAWSSLRKVSDQGSELRFPSREFPPKGLYAEPYRLALVPMAGREETPGFAAFDAADLEICAHIVWQLVTFLKVVRLYREATQGRQLAEEANRLKSRFLSTVSHELHTPLGLIVGLSEILLQEKSRDFAEIQRDLKRIHASAQHLDGLIRDVLDLAQNEMGDLKLVCAPLDLPEVLKVVAAAGEQLAQDKGLAWQASIPTGLPSVWGDRTRLRQVALNLISNAVKFTAQGSVSLRVSAVDQTVRVEVSDTGLGIPPEEQGIIFDEFRQSDRAAALGYGGLGLGLAICKRLVELHGGRIGVYSSGKEGEGSTFYFTLPVLQAGRSPDLPGRLSQERSVLVLAERRGKGERLREYLVQRGFTVDLEWLDAMDDWLPQRLKSRPGAVVLDAAGETAMQRGWEVVNALRDIPVLFYAFDESQERGSVLEFKTLAKPLNRSELIQALERQENQPGAGQRARTILIVDDEASTLELHARLVAAWSPAAHLLKARNGREALDAIREMHPDLVLLDLVMPEMDGFGVLEAMRNDPSSRDIPVVVLTGQTLTLEDMQHLGRGVTSVLSKGMFSAEETLAHIETALARSAGLGSEAQRFVRKAMGYLHEHYMEAISLEDTARYVSISKEYLARCFRQELGVTLVTYLNRFRVRQAKALLDQGRRNLTEIALETGFSSSAYFSRIFRQETGMSPRDYQRPVK